MSSLNTHNKFNTILITNSPTLFFSRFSLNYKRIPYKALQLEYPDIEPTLRNLGAAPTSTKPNGHPYYTVPVIVDSSRRTPDGRPTIVYDSLAIAEYLDDAYPDTTSPLLFPQGTRALQVAFYNRFIDNVFIPAAPMTVCQVLYLLNEASQTYKQIFFSSWVLMSHMQPPHVCRYWRVTREAYFGNKLEEICPKGSQKFHQVFGNFQKGK